MLHDLGPAECLAFETLRIVHLPALQNVMLPSVEDLNAVFNDLGLNDYRSDNDIVCVKDRAALHRIVKKLGDPPLLAADLVTSDWLLDGDAMDSSNDGSAAHSNEVHEVIADVASATDCVVSR